MHQRRSSLPQITPVEVLDTLAEDHRSLDYVHMKTKDVSLGQNALDRHQKALRDRATMRDEIKDRLADKFKKLKTPRNLKCVMDRDVDFRKKQEDLLLKKYIPLVDKMD